MTYRVIDNIFDQIDETLGASEAHGIAVGMLCVDLRADCANWLAEVVPETGNILEEDRALLVALFERTRELLMDEGFEFDLLLPDDESLLHELAERLRDWCQGFLFGVGYASSTSDWSGETGEIMNDILQFTRLDTEVSGEDDENALMEINEYLRAAVLLVKEELNAGQENDFLH